MKEVHHTHNFRIEYDTAALVPGWRDIVGAVIAERCLSFSKLDAKKHPLGGIIVHVEYRGAPPSPWTGAIFECAAFDAAEALRRAWTERGAAPAPEQFVVFYSWQSTSPKTNRSLIGEALEKAVKALKKDGEVTVEPVIDRDTAGVPGSPDIAATIFAKIEKASMFVADVSLVIHGEGRSSPNPNVLVELGYAAHALGWDRILLVANTVFGELTELPFDLRPRRSAKYEMSVDEAPAAARSALTVSLQLAIREAMSAPSRRVSPEQSMRDNLRKLFANVTKAANLSFAPVMLASTLQYPGVSRDEYAARLAATLPTVIGMRGGPPPDPATMQTGPCKGEVVRMIKVTEDGLLLEIPPHDFRVSVPFEQVKNAWRHDLRHVGLLLAVAVMVPSKPDGMVRLIAE